jgi:hypothetical protein
MEKGMTKGTNGQKVIWTFLADPSIGNLVGL